MAGMSIKFSYRKRRICGIVAVAGRQKHEIEKTAEPGRLTRNSSSCLICDVFVNEEIGSLSGLNTKRQTRTAEFSPEAVILGERTLVFCKLIEELFII